MRHFSLSITVANQSSKIIASDLAMKSSEKFFRQRHNDNVLARLKVPTVRIEPISKKGKKIFLSIKVLSFFLSISKQKLFLSSEIKIKTPLSRKSSKCQCPINPKIWYSILFHCWEDRGRERDREKREKEKERKCARHVSDFSFEFGIPVAVCETFSCAFVVV